MDTLLAYLSLFLCFIYSVECLLCLQCSSLGDEGCLHGAVEAKPCYNETSYCIKYETKDDKIKFITRDCSDEWLSGCKTSTVEGKQLTVCKESCATDGCNGAPSLTTTPRDITHILTVCALVALCVIGVL